MKIVSLTAENVKKLTVVEIKPDGNLVQITGKNGQGKSSVLDAIWWALAGQATIQAAPIRKGATEARITLDLGDIIVRRTFKQKTSKQDDGTEKPEDGYTTAIIVENADGSRFPSPQRMLDGLLGALAFDPLAFANMSAKEQFDTLKRFVPGVDFDAIEKANAADYQARTDINRRAKEARTVASEIKIPADVPAEPIDQTALVRSLEEAGKHNSDLVSRRERRNAAMAEAKGLQEQAKDRRERAARLRAEAQSHEDAAKGYDEKAADIGKKLAEAPELPAPIDTGEISTAIDKARETNKWVEARARKAAHEKAAADFEAQSKRLTAGMEKREADKRKAIASAKLPIPNIEFGDGLILMNGVPFDQASDAEKLRASVSIAMAMNPKLRVVRVRDGSLLDEDGMRLVAEMADKADCQVWIERVDSSGKIGFVLEDGHLKGAADAKKEAAE